MRSRSTSPGILFRSAPSRELLGGIAGLSGSFGPVILPIGTVALEWLFLLHLYRNKIFLRFEGNFVMTSQPHDCDKMARSLNRRELLGAVGMGFGLVGLAGILADENQLASNANAGPASGPSAPEDRWHAERRISPQRPGRQCTCS